MQKNFRISESVGLQILEGAAEGILIIDIKDLTFKYANRAICLMLGYSSSELLQLSAYDIHPSEDQILLQKAFEELANGEIQSAASVPCRRKDGSSFYANIHASRIVIDGIQYSASFFSDITEKKRAEGALLESEKRYKMVSELISDYVYKMNISIDGKITMDFVTDNFTSITGRTPNEINTFESLVSLVLPEDQILVIQSLQKLLESAGAGEVECRSIVKDNQLKWFRILAQPVWNEKESRVVSIIGAVMDITERKKSELLLEDIIEKNPMSIQVVDKEGFTIKVNSAHKRLFGALPPSNYTIFNDSQVMQQGLSELMIRARNGEVVYFPDIYYNTHQVSSEFPDVTFWIRTVIFPIYGIGSTPEKYVLIHEDITARKRAEDELIKVKSMFEAALEQSPIGIQIASAPDIHPIMVNKAAEIISGVSADEQKQISIEKTDNLTWSLFHLDGTKYDIKAWPIARTILSGEVIKNEELLLVRADGTKSYISVNAAPIRDPEGKIIGGIVAYPDITEQKINDEKLRESEQRYHNFITNASEGIYRIDFTQTININQPYEVLEKQIAESAIVGEVNTALTSMYGITPAEMVGCPVKDFAPNCGVQMADLLQTPDYRISEREEVEYSTDGTPIHIVESYTGVVENDILLRVWGVQRNITERKLAEEALRKSETKFKGLIDLAVDAILLGSPDGFILVANQRAGEISGYSIDELKGSKIEILFSDEERSRVPMRYDLLKKGQIVRNERFLTRKDGSLVPIEMNTKLMPDGTYQTFIRDITERKIAEEALSAEKERLAVTLRSIGDGVITTDIQGRVVIMNRIAEKLTGWPQSEAENQPLELVFNIINEITRNPVENPVEKVLTSGKIIELANHTILISRDGTERIIADSGAPIKDKDSITRGVVLVFRDMTEKQKLLETAQQTQKLESLGILAGGIAHDFNNLLGGIFGFIDLAKKTSTDLKTKDYLTKAINSMNRARGLTQQLLTFAKGGTPIRQLDSLFPFIQETVQFALSGSNISCQFDVPEDLWLCNFDKNQVGQVIDNIIINAQQAMPMGGRIDISAKNIFFESKEHASLPEGNYVKLSIRDRGIGIPKEILSRIFDPFFTTKQKGHGLGLATCYSIIAQHLGSIEVESEPGKGSVFHIYLPASSDSLLEAEARESVIHRGSGRLLVVDDEDSMCEVISEMLASIGYTSVCLKDGREALDFFIKETSQNNSFIGVILDLTIPGGMGGKETIVELRKLDSRIPVFASSGYAEDPLMAKPEKYGFTGSIPKPFRIEDLQELLERFIPNNIGEDIG